MIRFLVVLIAFLTIVILKFPPGATTHTKVRVVVVHNCPSAMKWGDELDVDYWC